jgi:hypothetical protein
MMKDVYDRTGNPIEQEADGEWLVTVAFWTNATSARDAKHMIYDILKSAGIDVNSEDLEAEPWEVSQTSEVIPSVTDAHGNLLIDEATGLPAFGFNRT